VIGNLTTYFPDAAEGIIAMHKFRGMTKAISCSNTSLDITFTDDDTFAYAKKTWDWVNGADNHSFVMVAGARDCGSNDERLPFIVTSLKYDEKFNIAHLKAEESDWESVAHSYDLDVGTDYLPPRAVSKLRKRITVNKDLSVNFEHAFPFSKLSLSAGKDFEVDLECEDCGTKGEFIFSFHLHTRHLVPNEATVKLHPKGVKASITPKLTLSANYTGSKDFHHDLPEIPIEAIKIPKILTVGPVLETAVGVEIGGVTGEASVSTGITIGLEDGAQVTFDLLGGKITHDNWTPTIEKEPLTVDAKLSAEVKLYCSAEVALTIKALGKFAMPYLHERAVLT
jgi:hypothetical protein